MVMVWVDRWTHVSMMKIRLLFGGLNGGEGSVAVVLLVSSRRGRVRGCALWSRRWRVWRLCRRLHRDSTDFAGSVVEGRRDSRVARGVRG